MKSFKSLLTILACLALLTGISHGAAFVSLFIDSGNRTLQNQLGAALPGGSTAVNFDGAVLQVGYFVSASAGNNFGGVGAQFIPLTGAGSLFNVNTTIGDSVLNGGDSGSIFSDRLDINAGLNGGANDGLFPAVDTPLSIRFYNATTIAASTFYATFSNNLWKWKAPANAPNNPIVNLFFDSAGLVAQNPANLNAGVAGTNLRTLTPTVAAPEPTSIALLAVGLASLAARRRRVAKV